MKYHRLILLLLWGLSLILIVRNKVYPQDKGKPLTSLKTNVMAPLWNSISFELDRKFARRTSWFLVAGLRSFPGEGFLNPAPCRKRRMAGAGIGIKYFLLQNSSGLRAVNGISLKPMLTYDFHKEVDLLCLPPAETYPFRTHYVGAHLLVAAQKSFLRRCLVELQVGAGYLLYKGTATESVPVGETGWISGDQVSIPMGINIGFTF